MKPITESDIAEALTAHGYVNDGDFTISDHLPEEKSFWVRVDYYDGGFNQFNMSYVTGLTGEIRSLFYSSPDEEPDEMEDFPDDHDTSPYEEDYYESEGLW